MIYHPTSIFAELVGKAGVKLGLKTLKIVI